MLRSTFWGSIFLNSLSLAADTSLAGGGVGARICCVGFAAVAEHDAQILDRLPRPPVAPGLVFSCLVLVFLPAVVATSVGIVAVHKVDRVLLTLARNVAFQVRPFLRIKYHY